MRLLLKNGITQVCVLAPSDTRISDPGDRTTDGAYTIGLISTYIHTYHLLFILVGGRRGISDITNTKYLFSNKHGIKVVTRDIVITRCTRYWHANL
jgi:hypothetical protein